MKQGLICLGYIFFISLSALCEFMHIFILRVGLTCRSVVAFLIEVENMNSRYIEVLLFFQDLWSKKPMRVIYRCTLYMGFYGRCSQFNNHLHSLTTRHLKGIGVCLLQFKWQRFYRLCSLFLRCCLLYYVLTINRLTCFLLCILSLNRVLQQ